MIPTTYKLCRKKISTSDVVLTGEGSFDSQSLAYGKSVATVVRLCKELHKPVVILCGRHEATQSRPDRSKDDPLVLPLCPTFDVEVAMQNAAHCVESVVAHHMDEIEALTHDL